jgi:uncharacterized membrane protein YfcA
LIVGVAAFLASALTLFSGFGLGTLLMPVFALLLPVETAIAATAVVHGANNLLKASLLGQDADWSIVMRFGVPAILAALLGAAALGLVSALPPMVEYSLGPRHAVITPVKVAIGALMAVFALFELLPRFRDVRFDRDLLVVGGLLSGLFGGFSGHQGALRSAFLAKVGLTTAAFVGTTAVVGLLVDLTRLAVYALALPGSVGVLPSDDGGLVMTGIVAALAGVVVARPLVAAVTMKAVQILTGVMLLAIAAAIGAGLI